MLGRLQINYNYAFFVPSDNLLQLIIKRSILLVANSRHVIQKALWERWATEPKSPNFPSQPPLSTTSPNKKKVGAGKWKHLHRVLEVAGSRVSDRKGTLVLLFWACIKQSSQFQGSQWKTVLGNLWIPLGKSYMYLFMCVFVCLLLRGLN